MPAYCEPPNPCPIGYTADKDGCLEEFENSAEFSRNYQAQQQCLCDQEHMFKLVFFFNLKIFILKNPILTQNFWFKKITL